MFTFENREQRDAYVAELDRKMADAKSRGKIWYPSAKEIHSVNRFDHTESIMRKYRARMK